MQFVNFISQEEAEFSRREKQLQDEINNWKQKVENLRKENNVCEIFWKAKYDILVIGITPFFFKASVTSIFFLIYKQLSDH